MRKIICKSASILALALMSITSHVSASSLIAPPTTIDGYLDTSDVIVLGRIGNIVKIHTFYGYQDSAAELERLDPFTSLILGVPMVDYEIIVDEVISTDGFYRGYANEPLIVRVMRNHDSIEKLALEEDMGNFLLFLSRTPDDTVYGYYSIGHKVSVNDDERPGYYFNGEFFDILDGNISSWELISKVRESAERR